MASLNTKNLTLPVQLADGIIKQVQTGSASAPVKSMATAQATLI